VPPEVKNFMSVPTTVTSLGKVKVDLTDFEIKLRKNLKLLIYFNFCKLPVPAEMSCKSFRTFFLNLALVPLSFTVVQTT
jgi:hypothetical protein